MRIGVTGSNGLVGSALVEVLARRGHDPVLFQRQPTASPYKRVPFVLGHALGEAAFEGLDAIIHCAYDFRARGADESRKTNVEGSVRFLACAKSAGIEKRIFVSSVSAFPGCESEYGKGKLAVEHEVASQGGVAIRPGLVFSPRLQGMFGSLWRIAKIPVLPLFNGGGQTMAVVHHEDLAEAIVAVLENFSKYAGKVFPVANPQTRTFRDLLSELARLQGRKVWFFSVPALWALTLLRLAEKCSLSLPFKSDSLLGLIGALPQYDFSLLPPLPHSYRNPIDLNLPRK